MDNYETRCPNCRCVNLSFAHACIRCGSILCSYGSTPLETHGFSWDRVYKNLISGNDDEVFYALSVIQQSRYEQLIPSLEKIFQGRHPVTNEKIYLDATHKASLLLAIGMIGTAEAGRTIVAIADKNKIDFIMDEILLTAACFGAGFCERTPELMVFVLNAFNTSPPSLRHFACEILKKFGDPTMLKDLFEYTISDINFASANTTTGYYGSGLLGIALSVADFTSTMQSENQLTTLMNLLPLASNASPMLVGKLSEDSQRIYALQRRIDVIESIVRRYGGSVLSDSTPLLKKGYEKFVAACVVLRLFPDPRDWIQPILDAVNGAWLTTSVATKLSGYDALVRLLKESSVPQWETLILAGLQNSNPIVRSSVASSILIHGLERFYPAVLQLVNDPKKEVRVSLVYGLVLLQTRSPELATAYLQTIAMQNTDKDARFLANRLITEPELAQFIQAML